MGQHQTLWFPLLSQNWPVRRFDRACPGRAITEQLHATALPSERPSDAMTITPAACRGRNRAEPGVEPHTGGRGTPRWISVAQRGGGASCRYPDRRRISLDGSRPVVAPPQQKCGGGVVGCRAQHILSRARQAAFNRRASVHGSSSVSSAPLNRTRLLTQRPLLISAASGRLQRLFNRKPAGLRLKGGFSPDIPAVQRYSPRTTARKCGKTTNRPLVELRAREFAWELGQGAVDGERGKCG